MLESLDVWTKTLLELKPTPNSLTGIKQFADWVGDRSDLVQAGSTGAPLFTFNRKIFVAQLLSTGFVPVNSTSWALVVANAWEKAVLVSIIKPGTTNDPVWTASQKDVLTAPIGGGTIITIPAGKAALIAGLQKSAAGFEKLKNENAIYGRIEDVANAFRSATSSFVFTLIGLAIAGTSTVPVPKPFKAS